MEIEETCHYSLHGQSKKAQLEEPAISSKVLDLYGLSFLALKCQPSEILNYLCLGGGASEAVNHQLRFTDF